MTPQPLRPRATAFLVVGLCLGAPLAWAEKPLAPGALIRVTNERIDKVLKAQVPGKPTDEASKVEMRAIAESFIDYDELGRKALAGHFALLGKAQQAEFIATMHKMIERKYEKQLKAPPEYKISYGEETVGGDSATVNTMVKVKTKGKSIETEVAYKLRKVGERWLVWDVVTDTVSMVATYREQFDKIINQEGFDALLKKMHKRASDTDDEAGNGAKKSGAGN